MQPPAERFQFGDAPRGDRGLHLSGQVDGRSSGTLREGEDVQEGRLDARQEIVRFAEFGLGLPNYIAYRNQFAVLVAHIYTTILLVTVLNDVVTIYPRLPNLYGFRVLRK